ncbi:uncharacterized protein PHACADRAFT_249229 [Phanerochaete carnosa HHB-10118-sp]|uniref:Uncharacterized protein n=1 Tax=Phanerochaete carnosa (strain HHB-10118-sp) TaxID=650164 RepID=K5X846_PHACS|nr:uncharacterized protein PHACADRAFT_249229 [Phanerochaete carnosa HHB-10118-sp]EKM59052.1 hypothetical protein PHACADRAFT_249229 [Phanerochaete carnosa HHB-10118-sp]
MWTPRSVTKRAADRSRKVPAATLRGQLLIPSRSRTCIHGRRRVRIGTTALATPMVVALSSVAPAITIFFRLVIFIIVSPSACNIPGLFVFV